MHASLTAVAVAFLSFLTFLLLTSFAFYTRLFGGTHSTAKELKTSTIYAPIAASALYAVVGVSFGDSDSIHASISVATTRRFEMLVLILAFQYLFEISISLQIGIVLQLKHRRHPSGYQSSTITRRVAVVLWTVCALAALLEIFEISILGNFVLAGVCLILGITMICGRRVSQLHLVL